MSLFAERVWEDLHREQAHWPRSAQRMREHQQHSVASLQSWPSIVSREDTVSLGQM